MEEIVGSNRKLYIYKKQKKNKQSLSIWKMSSRYIINCSGTWWQKDGGEAEGKTKYCKTGKIILKHWQKH